MKRLTKFLVLTLTLIALLTVSAFAADFTHCADALNDLGLFQGTDSGYDLDRAPTRAEAGAMLVRLLGAEDEALKMEKYTAPFTDVRDWAKPYVQYLYDNGLTNGKTETTFGYSDKCTAQQYATFLLRALGYSDAKDGDFTYANAMDFAREKGVVDYANCDEKNFLRDDVVAMSFTALATAPKSGEADLLTKLVKDGAIADAKGYDKKFEFYHEYLTVAQADADADRASMSMTVDVDMKIAGEDFISGTVYADSAADRSPTQPDAATKAECIRRDLTVNPSLADQLDMYNVERHRCGTNASYYADGYLYLNLEGAKLKLRTPWQGTYYQSDLLPDLAHKPICLLKDISKSGATYTLIYAGEAMTVLTGQAMANVELFNAIPITGNHRDLFPYMTIADTAVSVTVQDGHMTGLKARLVSTVEMDHALMNITGKTMSMVFDMEITNVKFGSSVNVSLPDDLSSYTEFYV